MHTKCRSLLAPAWQYIPGVAIPELEALRQSIDEVDRRILTLIAERLRLVLEVGDLKRARQLPVRDAERERSVIERLVSLAPAPLSEPTVRRIFECIIDEARNIEEQHVSSRE